MFGKFFPFSLRNKNKVLGKNAQETTQDTDNPLIEKLCKGRTSRFNGEVDVEEFFSEGLEW